MNILQTFINSLMKRLINDLMQKDYVKEILILAKSKKRISISATQLSPY